MMPTSFIAATKSFLLLLFHIFFTVLFALFTWAAWGLYKEEKLTTRYEQEGQPVAVTVGSYNNTKKYWADYIQNVKYINFQYKGKYYNTRCVQDSSFIGEGSKVWLLYNPSDDAFRQSRRPVYNYRYARSKLIGWTSASLLSKKNIALMALAFVSIAFFFLLAGLLAQIPGLSFIRSVSVAVLQILLAVGAVYISYNAYSYYHYYYQVKAGQPQQATVLDKSRYYQTRHSGNTIDIPFRVVYIATVNFRNTERVIPISENDYNKVEKGSQLNVLYNDSLDDMMAADYKMNPLIFIFTALTWLIVSFFIYGKVRRKKNSLAT